MRRYTDFLDTSAARNERGGKHERSGKSLVSYGTFSPATSGALGKRLAEKRHARSGEVDDYQDLVKEYNAAIRETTEQDSS